MNQDDAPTTMQDLREALAEADARDAGQPWTPMPRTGTDGSIATMTTGESAAHQASQDVSAPVRALTADDEQ